MAIQDPPRSESEHEEEEEEEEQEEESESSGKSISDEGEEDGAEEEKSESRSGKVNGKQGISEYEKQRLRRISENKARMEALGLHKMASSLMGSVQKSGRVQKSSQGGGKRKNVDDDEDYTPHDHDGDDEDDDDDDLDDEDFVGSKSSSKPSKNKVKNKGSNNKKKVLALKNYSSEDYVAEDDNELMQAIALSLIDCAKDSNVKDAKGSARVQEDTRRVKRKKLFSSRVKMTEDELVLNFFQFDEAGKGIINLRDLRRMATAHDFTWTDKELADMIYYFDSDRDGKLNLYDFRKVVGRCNMIEGAEEN